MPLTGSIIYEKPKSILTQYSCRQSKSSCDHNFQPTTKLIEPNESKRMYLSMLLMPNGSTMPPSGSKIHKNVKKFPRAVKLASFKELLRPQILTYNQIDFTRRKLNNVSSNDISVNSDCGDSFRVKNPKMSIFQKIANRY